MCHVLCKRFCCCEVHDLLPSKLNWKQKKNFHSWVSFTHMSKYPLLFCPFLSLSQISIIRGYMFALFLVFFCQTHVSYSTMRFIPSAWVLEGSGPHVRYLFIGLWPFSQTSCDKNPNPSRHGHMLSIKVRRQLHAHGGGVLVRKVWEVKHMM